MSAAYGVTTARLSSDSKYRSVRMPVGSIQHTAYCEHDTAVGRVESLRVPAVLRTAALHDSALAYDAAPYDRTRRQCAACPRGKHKRVRRLQQATNLAQHVRTTNAVTSTTNHAIPVHLINPEYANPKVPCGCVPGQAARSMQTYALQSSTACSV